MKATLKTTLGGTSMSTNSQARDRILGWLRSHFDKNQVDPQSDRLLDQLYRDLQGLPPLDPEAEPYVGLGFALPKAQQVAQLVASVAETNGSQSKLLLAFEQCRKWEVGLVDHPNDPGGRTGNGVTQRRYDQYRRDQGLPLRDVWDIALEEELDIFKQYYWNHRKLAPRAPVKLAIAIADTCYNFGPGDVEKFLQVSMDLEPGGWGPISDRHFEIKKDEPKVLARLLRLRKEFREYRVGILPPNVIPFSHSNWRVKQDPTQKVFLEGWYNRDNDLITYLNSL
jgi:hypothetical protein